MLNIIAYNMQTAPADEADAVCLWKQIYEEGYVLYERGTLYIYAPAGRSPGSLLEEAQKTFLLLKLLGADTFKFIARFVDNALYFFLIERLF